jgi:hypothetical protein
MKYEIRLFLIIPVLFLGFFVSTSNALEVSYTYDSMNRIISAAYSEGINTTSLNYQYDAAGNMVKFSVTASGPPPCPQCSGDPIILKNTTFKSDALCECAAATSITIGAGVTIEKDATVIFKAPKVYVKPGAHFARDAHVEIKRQ